jgi:hypothetical protein
MGQASIYFAYQDIREHNIPVLWCKFQNLNLKIFPDELVIETFLSGYCQVSCPTCLSPLSKLTVLTRVFSAACWQMISKWGCLCVLTLQAISQIINTHTVFQTANTCLNIWISTCPIATYISLDANSGIHVARVSNQSATSSDGALWLDTLDNKCFTVGIKWYVHGNRASSGIQCIVGIFHSFFRAIDADEERSSQIKKLFLTTSDAKISLKKLVSVKTAVVNLLI